MSSHDEVVGYEVLDAYDGRAMTAAAPPAAGRGLPTDPEVTELEPGDVVPTRPGVPSPPRRWRALGPVALALVVGVLLGSVVTRGRAEATALAERRATLSVDARITGSVIGGQRLGQARISLTARLRNFGPEPVEAVVDDATVVATRQRPVVVTGTDARIAPGASTTLMVELSVNCTQLPLPVLGAKVRTVDGQVRKVPLRSSYGDPVETLCGNVTASTPWVSAEIVGSTDRPRMLVVNGRPTPVRLDLPVRVSSGPGGAAGLIRVDASPRFPIVVPAGGRQSVRLTVTATRCERDLDVVAGLASFANPALRVTAADGRPLATSTSADQIGTRVDLSTLVDQALARACG